MRDNITHVTEKDHHIPSDLPLKMTMNNPMRQTVIEKMPISLPESLCIRSAQPLAFPRALITWKAWGGTFSTHKQNLNPPNTALSRGGSFTHQATLSSVHMAHHLESPPLRGWLKETGTQKAFSWSYYGFYTRSDHRRIVQKDDSRK